MRKVYISVVSHCHADIIKSINCLPSLASKFVVILKSNRAEDLSSYCVDNNIFYLPPIHEMGFGENNNYIFKYAISSLGMTDNDIFIVMNPDVNITESQVTLLMESMVLDGVSFATINLYRDSNMTIHDYSVRKFPNFFDFFSSFIGLKNNTKIIKENIVSPCFVDWAAGSFLAFRVASYKSVFGFDPKYFMYCEDIDICYRLGLINVLLVYYPHIKAIHHAQHKNKNLFSKHFFWHIRSVFIFLFTRYKNS